MPSATVQSPGGCECEEPPPVCTRTVTVVGCRSNPLPGAVVTMTSSGGIVTSGTTDSSGVVVLAHGAASGAIAATHPSGRFSAFSGSFSGCTGTASQTITMTPATGHSCCWGPTHPAALRDSPYPVNVAALEITDPAGTQSFPQSGFSACNRVVCSGRSGASDVGLISPPTYVCFDTYLGYNTDRFVDLTTTTGTVAVRYAINLGNASLVLNQQFRSTASAFLINPGETPGANPCSLTYPDPGWIWQQWRYDVACGSTAGRLESHDSVSVTVNSVDPLNLTFAFAPGDGYGPVPVVWTGSAFVPVTPITFGAPYSTSIVVSEP